MNNEILDNFDELLDTSGEDDFDESEDNFDELLEGDEFTDLFDDDFTDLLGEDPDGVSPEVLLQTKQNNIKESLVFMSWVNQCLREKWLGVPITHSDINDYAKISGSSRNITMYLGVKDKCKQSQKNNNLMSFINLNLAIRIAPLQNAIATHPSNMQELVTELNFYLSVLKCKSFDEIAHIPCRDLQLKRTWLQDISLMRDIWELGEDEKVPTLAMRMVDSYRQDLDEESYALPVINLDNPEDILPDVDLSGYALPTSIEYTGGKCIVKCECGETVDATELITFNIINIDSNELSHTKLNELAENCRDERIDKWLRELQNPETVFTHPSNTEMLVDLHAASKTLASGVYNIYRNYITTSYGCACKFSPKVVCPCGKHIVLPAKLLRYLVAWHASHGEDIYRHYTENVIAPGAIKYRDGILLERLETYQRNIHAAGEAEIQRAITNLGDGIDTEALRRNSMARVQIEAGPVLETNNQKLITSRSVKEAFDRIKSRESKHVLKLSRYTEGVLESKKVESKEVEKQKGALPLDYWRIYNTTTEDKLMSALIYVVDSLHLPFETAPKYVLSEIFRQPKSKRVRDIILMQAWYTNIMCNFDIYKHYLDNGEGDIEENVRSVDAKNGTWRLDESNKYELLNTIIGYLRKYSEYSGMFTEEELSVLDDYTQVNYSTIKSFIETLKSRHSIPYQAIRKPKTFNPPNIQEVHDIDTEIIHYITDELPWRMWYKLALVSLIEAHNPGILAALSTNSSASTRVSSGAKKLNDEIIASAMTGDVYNGEFFWQKIPQNMRGEITAVLNKNLQEVALLNVEVPLPLTSNMIALMLQSDNVEDSKMKVDNYIKTHLLTDIMERYSPDELNFDSKKLDSDKVWMDAIDWITTYTPKDFTFALPKYIRELATEVL